MKKVIVLTTEDEKQQTDLIHDILKLVDRYKGASAEEFDTSLEAFADAEGPFRISQMIEDGDMKQLEDEELLKEMGKEVALEIAANLVDDTSDYSSILDYNVLNEITTDCAIRVLKEKLKAGTLNDHDKAVTEEFIGDYDFDGQDDEDDGRKVTSVIIHED